MATNKVTRKSNTERIQTPSQGVRAAKKYAGKMQAELAAFVCDDRGNLLAFENLPAEEPLVIARCVLTKRDPLPLRLVLVRKRDGAPTPMEADRQLTIELRRLIGPLNVMLTDFIIVGNDGKAYSFSNHVERCLHEEHQKALPRRDADRSAPSRSPDLGGILMNLAASAPHPEDRRALVHAIAKQAESLQGDTISAIESIGHLLSRIDPREVAPRQVNAVGFLLERLASEAETWARVGSNAVFEAASNKSV